ncbi:PaaI family thioesterase [Streptococcus plurextorum]|uniref:PaaI family thioesterase n=1 Tax=Streptococcus plurextorum TaxID=456876 RepID=UPI00040B5E25|nr:PaaI family thioesterase [Streptococcus plurextorum]
MDMTLQEIKVFENYTIETAEKGHVVLSTRVVDSSLNYYGNAHGGYLFTLCDQVAGLVVRSTDTNAVTLQSNINYLRPGRLADRLTVEGLLTHSGRTTKVVDVTITNSKGKLICKGAFTMFVTP